MKRITDLIGEYPLYRASCVLSRVIPRKFAYWVGLRVADVFYRRHTTERRAVMNNLRQIMTYRGMDCSDEKLAVAARMTFQYFGKYLVDFFRYTSLTREEVDKIVTIEHREYWDQALAAGNGIIAVTAHLGNWEMGGAVMAAYGYKINAVTLPAHMEKIESLFQKQRMRRGINPIPLGRAVGGVLRALRRKEVVALLVDRDFSRHQDRLMFFGRPARLPRGPARLAAISGAMVLPGFLLKWTTPSFCVFTRQ